MTTFGEWDDPSLDHLWARIQAIEDRVRAAVDRRRYVATTPDDAFRGLYVSPRKIDELLDGAPPMVELPGVEAALLDGIDAEADAAQSAGARMRLLDLRSAFGIDFYDAELLLIALVPDIDPRFEQLYGYLNDNVSRRRATVGLALELSGLSAREAADRRRLSVAGRLVQRGLLLLEDVELPTLARSLRVPDRITAFLLGDDSLNPEVERILDASAKPDLASATVPLARAMAMGVRLAYVVEVAGSSAVTSAVAAVALTGTPWLALDLGLLAGAGNPRQIAAQAIVEARLRNAVLVAGPVDALADRHGAAVADLADSGWPVVLYGDRAWEPGWCRTVPLQVEAPVPDSAHRAQLWQSALENQPEAPRDGSVQELVGSTRVFHLSPPQISRAVKSALLTAVSEQRDVTHSDLQAGARRQNAAGLERLARRIEPVAAWDDLVVPEDLGRQLRELAARARQRDRVLGEWKIGGHSARGRGITALFAGESGTGKTLSAEVIARELGLDLYVIDLSTVVDKYIGETEKNLDRIFSEADRVNGVLLFDEADAIFGKRSEVRDARDRYANVEVAYLLQRMERFDGLAVLTTNLRSNIDESFTRRIDVIVDFPKPDDAARLALWRMHLPEQLPKALDLDLEFLARRFALAGGDIRNVCLTAAYLAADAGTPVGMADLIRATGREYRKLGRLTTESEFGRYHRLLTVSDDADRATVAPLEVLA